nr:RnfH family protein [Marinicella sp. W31]MDC2879607.1 RnfH family protein [Marinicella sp. W31]
MTGGKPRKERLPFYRAGHLVVFCRIVKRDTPLADGDRMDIYRWAKAEFEQV